MVYPQSADQVSLAPTITDSEPISLAPQLTPASAPSENTANRRASQVQQGLGSVLEATDSDIYTRLVQGQEDQIRLQAAFKMDSKNRLEHIQGIQYALGSDQGALTQETLDRLRGGAPKPVDPNTVIEQAYTNNALSTLNTAATSMGGTVWTDALVGIPGFVNQETDKASDFGTKRQFLQTQLENAVDAESKQTWPSYIFDQSLQLSQIYTEAKERDFSVSGLGLSSNIKEQADRDFRLDNKTFADTVGSRLSKMISSNPSVAKDYITRLLGESDKDAFIGNFFTALAIPDIYGGGKAVAGLAKKVFEANQIRKAVTDVLAEASKPDATPSSIQAAAGDLKGAAIQDVTKQVVDDAQGASKPEMLTHQRMTENFNLDVNNIGQGTPRNREITTRLQDVIGNSTKDIGNTILTMNKVNRTPLSTAGPEVLNAVAGEIKQDYRGPWNSLLNVHIDRDSWNPFTNTWDYILDIGNMNGEHFSHPDTAKNFVRDYNLGDAKIFSREGVQVESADYTKTMADINKAKDLRRQYQNLAAKHQVVINDPKASLEAKKEARSLLKDVREVGIKKKDAEIAKLEASLNTPTNVKRLAEIKVELETLKTNGAAKLFPEEYKAKKAMLEQESRALNYGNASAINKGPVIRQQGVGYYIQIKRPLDETKSVMRDLMIKDLQKNERPEAVSSKSWVNTFLNKYRSPEDTLSKIENQERKAAVYSKAVLEKLADGMGKYIDDLARGRKRFDNMGNLNPWYLTTPRYVAGIPYKYAKNLVGRFANPEIGEKATVLSNSRKFQEWERAVDYARRAKAPDGSTGWFFQNQGQLEDYYLRTFQRMPGFDESVAYFAKVALDEYNRVLTNIAVYRNKSRIGTMSHKIILTDGTTRVASPAFDGVQRDKLPGAGNIVIMDNQSGKPSKVMALEDIKGKQRDELAAQVNTGKLKVIELWDPETRPLAGFGNVEQQRVRYVLSDAVDSEPISFNQVNRRGGGHFDYEYEHYLKQAIVRNEQVGNRFIAHYEGDTSVMALANRAMGHNIAGHLDQVRQYLKKGRVGEARDWTRKNLMMEFDGDDGVHSWFKPGRDANGKIIPPRLNMDEKFHVVPKGKNIVGLDASLEQRITKSGYTFENGTNSGSLARQFQVAYTNERDAYNLIAPTNIGTNVRPLYKYEPAKLVDALPTMQRSLNNAIKSTFMDDYKMFAVEHWLREAETHLKEGPEAARSSPFYHFNNPVYRDGTPHEVEKNLEANRYKIQQFVGIPSEFDTTIHSFTQNLVDAAYNKGVSDKLLGSAKDLNALQVAGKAVKAVATGNIKDTAIVPIWMLNRIHDPITKIRSLTYNFKLGLFNVPQLLVQAQTHASIWAIAGRNGGAGTYASFLHQWSRFGDDAFLRHLDQYATKLNFLGSKWKPGEFYEARKELQKTGFEHVAGEYAVLDDAHGYKYGGSDFGAFLSMGQQFFKEGERSTRLTAWYTAFKEYRATNPTGPISKEARTSILQRADLLTTNMSRASSSALHTGVLGLSTQFLSYQLRMAELFMGKRLGDTWQQRSLARLRLFGVYSALYGVPAAFGISGLPVSEDVRAAAINYGFYPGDDKGYVPGQNWISSLVMEGIPSLVTALVTGEGDIKKGNFYNYGDRYGSQGFTQIREALRSDTAWWKLIGGAGITTVANTIMNMDGLTKALGSMIRGDSGDARFALKTADIIEAGKEISSVSAAYRLITAMNTGKWVAKNEGNILPVSTADAVWMTLTGLSHQEQDDIYTKGNILKAQDGAEKYATTKFITEIHRMIEAQEKNNPEQAHDFLRRGYSYLEAAGMTSEKKAVATSMALKSWEARADKADFSFYITKAPGNRAEQRRNTYTDILKSKRN